MNLPRAAILALFIGLVFIGFDTLISVFCFSQAPRQVTYSGLQQFTSIRGDYGTLSVHATCGGRVSGANADCITIQCSDPKAYCAVMLRPLRFQIDATNMKKIVLDDVSLSNGLETFYKVAGFPGDGELLREDASDLATVLESVANGISLESAGAKAKRFKASPEILWTSGTISRPPVVLVIEALLAIVAFAIAFRWISQRDLLGRRRTLGHCLSCGYDLHCNKSGICPECGVSTPDQPNSQ